MVYQNSQTDILLGENLNATTFNISKLLCGLLRPRISSTNTYIKDSPYFIKIIKAVSKTLAYSVSFEVAYLFAVIMWQRMMNPVNTPDWELQHWNLEKTALISVTKKSTWEFRYGDNTFCDIVPWRWCSYCLLKVLGQPSPTHPSYNEKQINEVLPLWEVLENMRDNGTLGYNVYQLLTHTSTTFTKISATIQY